MSNVVVILEMGINDGQADNFDTFMNDMIGTTREEPGSLTYEWSVNPERTTCHVIERFADSDAVMAHLGSLQAVLGQFIEIFAPQSLTVTGSPSEEVKAALAMFGPKYFEFAGGFRR